MPSDTLDFPSDQQILNWVETHLAEALNLLHGLEDGQLEGTFREQVAEILEE